MFSGQIAAWLWFTVLFANFAEAVAEGRGKAQADALRRTRSDTRAKRYLDPENLSGVVEGVNALDLRLGDIVLVEAGDIIPGDGDIVEGVASVNESAITGESAPVIREAGGDRSAVTGGTTVLSDFIKVKITSAPGSTFIDRMIALVEGRGTAEDAERTGAVDPAVRPDHHLPDRLRHALAARQILGRRPVGATVLIALLVCLIPTTIGGLSVGDRHRRHGPAGPFQCHRDLRPRGRGGRRRRHAAARQDGHDHVRQSDGDRASAGGRRLDRGPGRRRACLEPRRRDARRPLDRRSRQGRFRPRRTEIRHGQNHRHSVLRPDAHFRPQRRRPLDPQGRDRFHPSLSQAADREDAARVSSGGRAGRDVGRHAARGRR